MNTKLEDTLKKLQLYILSQYKDNNQKISSTTIESKNDQNSINNQDSTNLSEEIQEIPISDENHSNNDNTIIITSENDIEQRNSTNSNSAISPISNILSPDIAQEFEDFDKNILPPSLLILFQEIYQTLDASSELRLNVRDSVNLSEHRHHDNTSLLQQTNEDNENLKNDTSETNSMSSLFGKMLHPSSFLENLRATGIPLNSSTSNNGNFFF